MLATRLLAIVVLLAIALYCGFGFLATFEPPGSLGLRIVYAGIGIGCLLVIALMLRKHAAPRP